MKVLLDTHCFLWAVSDTTQLSLKARRVLEDPRNRLIVSSVNIWEMSIKYKAGRWPEVAGFMDETLYADFLEKLGAEELAITSRHARVAGQFDAGHKDPFDRMIAAQAFLEELPLVSKDDVLDAFPISRIW